MKRTPLRPGQPPRRSRAIARGSASPSRSAIPRVNPKRKAREFRRTYGSAERAAWIRALPSVWDGAGPCVNAHVGKIGKGASRKANADQIVSLTPAQHDAFDLRLPPFDDEAARAFVIGCCAGVERAWQEHDQKHVGSTEKSRALPANQPQEPLTRGKAMRASKTPAVQKDTASAPVPLTVEGHVREGGMYLRTEHASGEVEHDGEAWEIEYAVTMAGTPMVTLQRKGAEQWTTYTIRADAIMRAVCDAHFAKVPA